ncbi:MAG: hypothetical protein ACREBR_04990 [bacterium]
MNDPYKFICLEDEIILRRAVRVAYEHEGMVGVYKCMGEMARSLEIVAEMAQELLDEERKAK